MTSANGANQIIEVFPGTAGIWTLDPKATTIRFQTRAMWGLAKVHGTFQAVEGSAQVTDSGKVDGSLVIDASSVDTGNKKRDNHLRSADFFESDNHPTFVFSVHGLDTQSDTEVTLNGSFTVRGHTRPLTVTATVEPLAGDTVELRAKFQIDRSDWGVSWSKMGAKTLTELDISARFTKIPVP